MLSDTDTVALTRDQLDFLHKKTRGNTIPLKEKDVGKFNQRFFNSKSVFSYVTLVDTYYSYMSAFGSKYPILPLEQVMFIDGTMAKSGATHESLVKSFNTRYGTRYTRTELSKIMSDTLVSFNLKSKKSQVLLVAAKTPKLIFEEMVQLFKQLVIRYKEVSGRDTNKLQRPQSHKLQESASLDPLPEASEDLHIDSSRWSREEIIQSAYALGIQNLMAQTSRANRESSTTVWPGPIGTFSPHRSSSQSKGERNQSRKEGEVVNCKRYSHHLSSTQSKVMPTFQEALNRTNSGSPAVTAIRNSVSTPSRTRSLGRDCTPEHIYGNANNMYARDDETWMNKTGTSNHGASGAANSIYSSKEPPFAGARTSWVEAPMAASETSEGLNWGEVLNGQTQMDRPFSMQSQKAQLLSWETDTDLSSWSPRDRTEEQESRLRLGREIFRSAAKRQSKESRNGNGRPQTQYGPFVPGSQRSSLA